MEIDVMHRMMADSGEGERESGEEGNEEDYTNHNKQQRWKSGDREGSSTHNMVNLCRSSAAGKYPPLQTFKEERALWMIKARFLVKLNYRCDSAAK